MDNELDSWNCKYFHGIGICKIWKYVCGENMNVDAGIPLVITDYSDFSEEEGIPQGTEMNIHVRTSKQI